MIVKNFFEGKSQDLSWMNYSHKYDVMNGPGKFYERFGFRFSNEELEELRHSPNKVSKAKTFLNMYSCTKLQ